jgi:hypothetical protein
MAKMVSLMLHMFYNDLKKFSELLLWSFSGFQWAELAGN